MVLNKVVTLTAEIFDQLNPVNNTTVIDGMGGSSAILIPAGLTQMPVVRGFVIQNSVDGIQSSSEFIAEFNYFHSSFKPTNYQMGAGGINRNNVYFKSNDDAIHLDDVNRPLLIENNRILYAGDDGIEISLQNTSIPRALIEVDIWNNMIIGSREDGIQFIDYTNDPLDTNRRFVIAGNLIANSAKAGIGLMPSANAAPPPSATLPPGVTPASPVPSSTLTFTPLPTISPAATLTPVPTITSTVVTPALPTATSTLAPTAASTLAITPTPQLTILQI